MGRLRELEAQGKVWGQDVLLGVRGHELLLSDVESRVPHGDPRPTATPHQSPPHVFQSPHGALQALSLSPLPFTPITSTAP